MYEDIQFWKAIFCAKLCTKNLCDDVLKKSGMKERCYMITPTIYYIKLFWTKSALKQIDLKFTMQQNDIPTFYVATTRKFNMQISSYNVHSDLCDKWNQLMLKGIMLKLHDRQNGDNFTWPKR